MSNKIVRDLPTVADTKLGDAQAMTLLVDPSLVTLYLPNGEVHVLRGVTAVTIHPTLRAISFVDRELKHVVTGLPFTLTFDPVENVPTSQEQ